MAAAFKYKSLSQSVNEIRLVELHTKKSGIVCTLHHVSVESAPPFEALSYCWGPQNEKVAISLNGDVFAINRNLHGALSMLKRIESQGEPGTEVEDITTRCLWIDAICIDQSNKDERSHQVKLMWSIYSCAWRVLVWLGEEQDDSSVGMKMIDCLSLKEQRRLREIFGRMRVAEPAVPEQEAADFDSNAKSESPSTVNESTDTNLVGVAALSKTPEQTLQSAQSKDKSATGTMSFFMLSGSYKVTKGSSSDPALKRSYSDGDLAKKEDVRRVFDQDEQSMIPFYMLLNIRSYKDAEDPPPWLAVMKIMQRPWWQRVWVIQEVAAAQGEVLVGCGPYWIDWQKFVLARSCVDTYKDTFGLERLHRFSAEMKGISDKFSLSNRTDGRLDSWNGLLMLLYRSIEYRASDPRDRIYALLGFTPSVDLEVNYNASVASLYEDFVRQYIRNTGNLHILGLSRKPKIFSLPSWIPDFSTSLSLDSYNISCPLGFFGADGNNWHNIGYPSSGCVIDNSDPPGSLTLSGFCYDEIIAIGTLFEHKRGTQFYIALEVIDSYEKLLKDIDNQLFPDRTCRHRQNEFWRTLIWNATEACRYPADEEYGTYFTEMREEEHYIPALDDEEHAETGTSSQTHSKYRALPVKGGGRHYYEAFIENGLNRRFFLTRRGNLGSGPADLHKDDQICILLGSKTPVVLRRVSSDSARERWEWVGQAYVHGIMHGEALGSLTSSIDIKGSRVAPINRPDLVDLCLI